MLYLTLPIILGWAAPPEPASIKNAVGRGVVRLEAAASNYIQRRDCFSCHHQALPMMALASVQRRGFPIDDKILAGQVEFTVNYFEPRTDSIREGKNLGGLSTMAVYALASLDGVRRKPDLIDDSLIEFLLKRQRDDGHFPTIAARPPSEGSRITSTSLALESFRRSIEDDRHKNRRERMLKAMSKGLEYLQKNPPADTEDIVFRLRGLIAGKAPATEIEQAKLSLLKLQRGDGGWGQRPELMSDAYATGSALVALHRAGKSRDDVALKRGLKWLIVHQDKSGAWVVQTRAKPVQMFFDNGDPGGKSQFMTVSATAWAVLALCEVSLDIRE